jgi:hypothetical protein
MAETGTHVEFGVIATNLMGPDALSYQWQINGTNIVGATNDTYWIDNVSFTNVATYTVVITGSNSITADPAHLAIYQLFATNSNGGTLSVPVGWFVNQNISCTSGGTFQRGFNPTNDSGLPAFFYHKLVPNQTGPFQNTASSKLTIDTFPCENGSGDTGLMLQRNWLLSPAVMCNDNSPAAPACHPLGAKGGPLTLSYGGSPPDGRYRLTLMYKLANPPPGLKVWYHWLYHD